MSCTRNREKILQYTISDPIVPLIKASALKKVKMLEKLKEKCGYCNKVRREYLQELRKSEFTFKERLDEVNKKKDRYIQSEVVANIMSVYDF